MIAAQLARNRAWRMLPLWAVAAALNTSVLLGVTFFRAATDRTSISAWTLTLVGWVGVASYLAFSDSRTRCTHFEASLPLRARSLWLNHLAALLAGGLLIVGLTLGVIALHASRVGSVRVEQGGWMLAVALSVGLLLAIVLLQLPRPSQSSIPATGSYLAWMVAVLLGMPLLLVLATWGGWPSLLGLLIPTLALSVVVYRRIPPAFALAPPEPQAATSDDVSSSMTAADGRYRRLLVPLTVLRGVSAGAKELMGVPFMLAFGIVLGGGLLALEGFGGRELRFLYLPMTTYMLFALVGPRMGSLHQLDPLPISRRRMAAALVVPYFVVLCVGYGLGFLLAEGTRSRLEYVNFEEGETGYEVTVPLRIYELSGNGSVAAVEAPWGESRQPEPLRPFGGSRAVVYSPYAAPPGSSARFVALQLSRAAAAVYGTSIEPATLQERYLETRADGSVVPVGDGLTLRADYPALRARSGPMFPVLVMLVAVPWLLLIALLLRAYRAGVPEWVRQTIVWGSLAVLLLFFVLTSVGSVFGGMQPWAFRALVEIPVMRLGNSTLGTLAAWGGALLLIAAAYVLVRSQFARMEIPTRPSQYTLLRTGQD